jgi:hypothetical protein
VFLSQYVNHNAAAPHMQVDLQQTYRQLKYRLQPPSQSPAMKHLEDNKEDIPTKVSHKIDELLHASGAQTHSVYCS